MNKRLVIITILSLTLFFAAFLRLTPSPANTQTAVSDRGSQHPLYWLNPAEPLALQPQTRQNPERVTAPLLVPAFLAPQPATTAVPPAFRGKIAAPVVPVGPAQLTFTAQGETHTFDHIAAARRIPSRIPGVAVEWQARPWHMPAWVSTSAPCGRGHTLIAGHVSYYSVPGPFAELNQLRPGDTVTCDAYEYAVTEIVQVPYTDIQYWRQPPADADGPTLTLYTCTPRITGIIVVKAVTHA